MLLPRLRRNLPAFYALDEDGATPLAHFWSRTARLRKTDLWGRDSIAVHSLAHKKPIEGGLLDR